MTRKPLRQTTASFEQLDANTQAQVARGEVPLGATADMVERALGIPTHIKAKASGSSVAATWIYEKPEGAMHVTLRDGQVSSIRQHN